MKKRKLLSQRHPILYFLAVWVRRYKRYLEWFIGFITNQDSLIRIKDTYTLKCMQISPAEFIHRFKTLDSTQLAELVKFAQ